MAGRLPVVVALGPVDPALVAGVFDGHCRFVPDPGAAELGLAEGAIGMALHLVKRFGTLTALVRAGRWAQRTEVPVGDLGGATLGVVGHGRIGQRTAQLGVAFGMRILAYDPVSEPPADVRCTGAVWRALSTGRLSGVGLDVFDPEPPRPHPLYEHPDVVLTPHLMGLSRRATAATFTAAAQGVLDVLAGREPPAPSPTQPGAPTASRRPSHDQLR